MCRSPEKDPRHPEKEKINGSGTGIGTLMPTMPTSTSCWNFLAAAPLQLQGRVPVSKVQAFCPIFSITCQGLPAGEDSCPIPMLI